MTIHVILFYKNEKNIFIKYETSMRKKKMEIELNTCIFEIAFKIDVSYLSIFGVYFFFCYNKMYQAV